ncbi:MAG: outer membrane lipoprotein carrier protein LolA [Rhodobacteraceae bacterium]|nr:outer membrane lipoprotein carrier protein LolA [Paracoccaceae bacterium]
MTRFLMTCALLMTAATQAQAQKLSLSEISQYFAALRLAEARFTQVTDDGYMSTGQLWISRPGKMRFDYDPPEDAFVVATQGAVFIVDGRSNVGPETYPLKRTPLNLLLARNVDLSQAGMVVGHSFDGTATIVTAQDPKNPELGQIEMHFTSEPVSLRKWVTTDGSGQRTTVILGPLIEGKRQSPELYREPRASRN